MSNRHLIFLHSFFEREPQISNYLLHAYAHPRRRYHGLGHIQHMFDVLGDGKFISEVRKHSSPKIESNFDVFGVAIWFHDAVYHFGTGHRRNEVMDSAHVARVLLTEAGDTLYPLDINLVVRLILTTDYKSKPDLQSADQYLHLFRDLDLSMLALPWAQFKYNNTVLLRWENSHLNDGEFAAKQESFMLYLLGKDHIFGSDYGRKHWEKSARRNIERQVRTASSQK